MIVLFLAVQGLDGAFTYLGLARFGAGIEANPLIASILPLAGAAATIAGAKLLAACLGIALYMVGLHRLVAVLTGVYVAGALLPWVAVFATA